MSTVTRRAAVRIALLLTAAAAAVILPSLAIADGDPASDTLLGENVFYPYSPPVPRSVAATLNTQTAAARRAGLPVKVALIAGPTDLGVIPSLFGKPQAYARFLDQEISFRGAQPLLVVMAAGYGVEGVPERRRSAVSALPKPAGRTSADLARAARTAVATMPSASGHAVKRGAPGWRRLGRCEDPAADRARPGGDRRLHRAGRAARARSRPVPPPPRIPPGTFAGIAPGDLSLPAIAPGRSGSLPAVAPGAQGPQLGDAVGLGGGLGGGLRACRGDSAPGRSLTALTLLAGRAVAVGADLDHPRARARAHARPQRVPANNSAAQSSTA